MSVEDKGDGFLGGVAVAMAVLAPLLTVGMAFRTSLLAQAVLMLGATLALLACAVARKGWRTQPAPPPTLTLGISLYGGAAVQGALVALLRGNDAKLIAGQLLAMGLLPLAALGAYWLSPTLGWRSFAAGVMAGTAGCTLVQLAATGFGTGATLAEVRLFLPNGVSAAGIAPMALFLALALPRPSRSLTKTLTWTATGLIALLILGSGIRSQWLVMPVGIGVYLALVLGRARLSSRPVVFSGITAAIFIVATTALTIWWWNYPRPNLVNGTLDSRAGAVGGPTVAMLPPTLKGAIRIRGTLMCQGSGTVWITTLDPQGAPLPRSGSGGPVGVNVAASVPAKFVLLLTPRSGRSQLSLRLEDPNRLGCTSTALAVEQVRPPFAALLANRVAELLRRSPDILAGPVPGRFASDSGIALRVRETSAVLGTMRRGSWLSWVFGHGLGATFALDTIGYDAQGSFGRIRHPNFIHNFYLFLAFKLGALGTVAVLAALALFVRAAVRSARNEPLESSNRRFFAAAAAAWITYILWSAAAPEILDFRVAPFWGVLIGLTASTIQMREKFGSEDGG